MHKSIKRAKKSEELTTANECNSMQQTVQANDIVNLEINGENETLKKQSSPLPVMEGETTVVS